MRVNVYSQEITKEVELVSTDAEDIRYYGVRFYLWSPEQLHYTPEDDDRSAVTFWIPNAAQMTTEDFAQVLYTAYELVRDVSAMGVVDPNENPPTP